MSRLHQLSPETASGRAKELLGAVKSKLGLVPNMTRAMASRPGGARRLPPVQRRDEGVRCPAKVREQLAALAVSQANGCDYCLAAHSAIGKMVGLTAEQVFATAGFGTAVDPRSDALIRFARAVVETRGRISEADLAEVRAAGFDDGAIAEVVAHVALNVFTHYFNNLAETDIDFPKAEPLPAPAEVASA